jgi:hypothetical protein
MNRRKELSLLMLKNKKAIALIIILAELVLAVISGLTQKKDVPAIAYTANDLYISGSNTGKEDEGCYIDTYELAGKKINTPATSLKRGIYNVSLSYQTDTEPDSEEARSSVYLVRGRGRIQTDVVDASGIKGNTTYTFYVNQKSEVVVSTFLNTEKGAYFLLNDVNISYDPFRSAARAFVLCIFSFALLDLVLLAWTGRKAIIAYFEKDKTNLLICIAMMVTLFLSCSPILLERLMHGDDLMFHLYRLGTMARSMRTGNFPVYIQPYWMEGYGYPNGIFYPDFFLYPFAVLHLLGLTVGSCYKLFILFTNSMTLFCSYYAGKKITENKLLSATGAIFYTLAGYRLLDLYKRSACGEFSALTYLPLVVAGIYLVYSGKKDKKERSWLILALGVSGVIYTHIISTMIISFFCVLFAIINIRKTFSKTVFPELMKAIGAALVISAGQTVPFLSSLIRFPIQGTVTDNSIVELSTIDLLAGLPTEEYYWNYRSLFTLGVLSIGVLLIGIITLILVLFKKAECSREHKILLINAVVISLISVWLTSTWFPYNFLSEKIHLFYHLLQAVQFAWRYFVIATVLAWLMVLILPQIYSVKDIRVLLVTVLILCLFQSQYQFGHYMAAEPYEMIYADISAVQSFRQEGVEFIPQGSEANVFDTNWSKPITAEGVEVTEIYNAGDKLKIQVTNNTDEDQSIEYPVFNWKYNAIIDGRLAETTNGVNNRTVFEVPAGFDGIVDLKFDVPWYWTFAKVLSFITSISIFICLLRPGFRAKGANK